jgi:hypothetical protein
VVGAIHHDDRGGDVVVMIAPGDAEPRHVADLDVGDVLDLHRDAVFLGQHDVPDVVDLVTLGQVVIAAVVDQPDAADVDRLLADRDLAPADIDVGIAERGDDLRDRQVVGLKLVHVDIDVELLGRAAPAVHLDNARDREQTAQRNPVLDRTQIGQPEMRRPDDLVAIDFAGQARLLDARGLVVGERNVLLQAQRRLRIGEVIIDTVFESNPNKRQPIERGRADVVDPGCRIEADLHRDRVITLHFFSRETSLLRRDFKDHGRRVGIGFDVEIDVGDRAGAGNHQQAEQDDRASRQTKRQKRLKHRLPHGQEIHTAATTV